MLPVARPAQLLVGNKSDLSKSRVVTFEQGKVSIFVKHLTRHQGFMKMLTMGHNTDFGFGRGRNSRMPAG